MRKLLPYVLLLLIALSCAPRAATRNQAAQPTQTKPAKAAPIAPAASSPAIQTPDTSTYFDSARAWTDLHTQVALGPRVPGTSSHRACRKYFETELLKSCDRVEKQEFSVNVAAGRLQMANVIGRFKPDAPRRILLAAHWDSRPIADNNPPGERNQAIPGANDGASGAAVLLELARAFHQSPPPVGVDLVFFDGEDYGPDTDAMFFGSRHFAERIGPELAKKYNYGILLDMVGDADLDIHPETISEGVAPLVYLVASEVAESMGYRCFKKTGQYEIEDDHVPLIERGIKMYDFIDFNYPDYPGTGTTYWHTTQDTEDKCSRRSLEAVGRTLERLVRGYPELYAPGAKS